MNMKCVRDVIGEPESWPNLMNGEWKGPPDMRGAIITEAYASGDQIAVQTKGAVCGETFSTFIVEDPGLRDRLTQVLRPGLGVHEAAAAAV